MTNGSTSPNVIVVRTHPIMFPSLALQVSCFQDAQFLTPHIQVGAGPVGLLTAVRLTHVGIPTTVLELLPGIEQSPRAAVYHPISVRELDRAGVLERAREIGISSSSVCWRKLNGEIIAEMGRMTVPDAEDDDNYETLVLGQHELARVILEAFENSNNIGKVLFQHKVVAIEQDDDGITVTAVTPDGGKKQLRAMYVVGADGGRSSVREILDIPFEGFTWPHQLVATNVHYPFEKYGYYSGNFIW
jgi:2-polyprenyl-6-methoxyphenol hydroxylase-like FAD-dependent oxidoreductase